MKVKIFFLMIVLVPPFAYSQDISKDEATIRVHYFFSQQEKAGEKPFRNDTMTLDIGSQMSCYYDETRALKDSLFNQIFPPVDRIKSISVLKGQDRVLDNYLGDKYEKNHFDGTGEKIYKNRMTGELTLTDHF
ncbi:hypothetical protein FACS1894177_05510 [Bacteroidia bacterium]|nr:hypothetical protein FACS1894177_05510 [Bacteroidia bacterium]